MRQSDNREGQILRGRRLKLGLTQEKVALELGMCIHQYQRYEYGENRFSNCTMRIGLRICEVLNLDPFKVILSRE